MSVVIAIKENGIIYMAADTMVTLGDSKRHLTSNSSQKIWAVNDTSNCIMGGAGYLRDINLIRYCTNNLVPEANIIKEDIDTGTIMQNTVPIIFDTIREYSSIVSSDPDDVEFASEFVWAYKDHLFHIMPDGLVEEIDDYCAIGSGSDAALASLQHTKDEPVYVRLYKALHSASEISLYVANPYVVIDTDRCELAVLELADNSDAHDSSEADEEPAPTKNDLASTKNKKV